MTDTDRDNCFLSRWELYIFFSIDSSAAGFNIIMQLQPSTVAELNSIVGKVPFNSSLSTKPINANNQSIDVWGYIDIENFRSTADGQIFRSLAYDDDNFVVRSLNFL